MLCSKFSVKSNTDTVLRKSWSVILARVTCHPGYEEERWGGSPPSAAGPVRWLRLLHSVRESHDSWSDTQKLQLTSLLRVGCESWTLGGLDAHKASSQNTRSLVNGRYPLLLDPPLHPDPAGPAATRGGAGGVAGRTKDKQQQKRLMLIAEPGEGNFKLGKGNVLRTDH